MFPQIIITHNPRNLCGHRISLGKCTTNNTSGTDRCIHGKRDHKRPDAFHLLFRPFVMIIPFNFPSCRVRLADLILNPFLIPKIRNDQTIPFSVTPPNLPDKPAKSVYRREQGKNLCAKHHPANGVTSCSVQIVVGKMYHACCSSHNLFLQTRFLFSGFFTQTERHWLLCCIFDKIR